MTIEQTVNLFLNAISATGVIVLVIKHLRDFWFRVKLDAMFPDGSEKLTGRIKESRTIQILITNKGRTSVKIDGLFFEFPKEFIIKEYRWAQSEKSDEFTLQTHGRFSDYIYFEVFPDEEVFLDPGEAETVDVDLEFPARGGVYTIYVVMYPVGAKSVIKELEISVT